MYIDHRKRNSDSKLVAKGATSERTSPAGPSTGIGAAGGLLSSLGSQGVSLPKFGSGRLSSHAQRTSAGSASIPVTDNRPPAGKPTRNSSPGEYKSHSFNGGGLFSAGGLSSSGKFTTPATPSGRGRTSFPLDLGASLTRSKAAATFRGSTSSLTASMPAASARPRTTAAPAEGMYVLDDCTITFGHSSFQGQRDYQEDTVAVMATNNCFLGGVFDGHGGDEVSKELERVLLQNINRKVSEALSRYQDDTRTVESAVHQAYTTTNEEIAGRMDKAQEAGSCAVTALIRRVAGRTFLVCANAGDCRAVLYTQSSSSGPRRAVRLSEDHKPHPNVAPGEITRICDAGGCVLWGRVQGCLAVSRAFGDRTLQPYVIADPHVSVRPLDPDSDMFVYLASDGVTDMIDDQQGCALVAEQLARGANAAQAAAALVSSAYHKGSCDNISVLVIRIRRKQPGDVSTVGNG